MHVPQLETHDIDGGAAQTQGSLNKADRVGARVSDIDQARLRAKEESGQLLIHVLATIHLTMSWPKSPDRTSGFHGS